MKCKICNQRDVAPKRRVCYHCLYLQKLKKDPIKIAFTTLKSNAKRRGKEFTITLDYFRLFCVKTDYINKKGIGKFSYHVDRIDEERGYVEGNLQSITNIENVIKYREFVRLDEEGKKEFTTKVKVMKKFDENNFEDLPF